MPMRSPRRRRLAPEERRDHLLDCARTIIAERGLSNLTMDSIAREADVSGPLVYKYFASRLELLQALLEREYDSHYETIRARLKEVGDFRAAVRVLVEVNFDQFAEGNTLNILLGQVDVRAAIRSAHIERSKKTQRYLGRRLMEVYGIDAAHADQLVALGAGVSVAAAEAFRREGGDKDERLDATVDFIVGGIEATVP